MRGGCKGWPHKDVCMIEGMMQGGYGAQVVMFQEAVFVRMIQEGKEKEVREALETKFKETCIETFKTISLKAYAGSLSDRVEKGDLTIDQAKEMLEKGEDDPKIIEP